LRNIVSVIQSHLRLGLSVTRHLVSSCCSLYDDNDDDDDVVSAQQEADGVDTEPRQQTSSE